MWWNWWLVGGKRERRESKREAGADEAAGLLLLVAAAASVGVHTLLGEGSREIWLAVLCSSGALQTSEAGRGGGGPGRTRVWRKERFRDPGSRTRGVDRPPFRSFCACLNERLQAQFQW